MNMNMLMQQAKKMQKDMENAKAEVSKMLFTSKQPLVEVTVNGDKVITQANKAMEDKLGNFASGIPGLF